MLGGSPTHPWTSCPRYVGATLFLRVRTGGLCSGVSKGRAAKPILLGCPLLLQLWCHEWFVIGQPVVPLYAYEPLLEGHDPRDHFPMGSLWGLWKVISYLSLSIFFCHFVLFVQSKSMVHV
jgi:hypothetical protein